ncbi:unnamed protein product [Ixodes hexagonus]
MIVHNKNSDSFDLLRYSDKTGTMMLDSLSTLLLDLEILAIKTCFEFESARDSVTPFNLCYKYLLACTRRFEYKIDFSQLHTYLQSGADSYAVRLTTNRHLVLPNNRTYDLYKAEFIPWESSQVCSVRSECDMDLGKNELVEHVHTEVYPTRGGLRYRCELVRRAIHVATRVFATRENLKPEFHHLVRVIGAKVVRRMSGYASAEAFMDDFLRDLCSTDDSKFSEYLDDSSVDEYAGSAQTPTVVTTSTSSAYKLYGSTVTNLLAFRTMLQRHPLLTARVMHVANGVLDSDDDGGPVVFVRKQITWEQMVWTVFVELFGSASMARMIMEFLALGLSTDCNGRIVLFLHGAAANGKSLFTGVLQYLFGPKNKLVRLLPSNFFTSKADNRMDATFRFNAEEVRFAIENEMSVLDMDEGGRRKFKQFTGGDRVANRQPYDKCNTDFRISAKFVTASNDLPYISKTMLAEQSRLMIVPTVSHFIAGKAALRTELLQLMTADRYTRKLTGKPYSSYEEYVREANKAANVMYGTSLQTLDARNTLFPEFYPTILLPSFSSDLNAIPRSIPAQRFLLRHSALALSESQEKMGAALCRILLNHVVPSMGGLHDTSEPIKKMEDYVRKHANLFAGYKDVFLVLLKRLIVYRKGRRVQVDTLRSMVTQELYDSKDAIRAELFGRGRSVGSEEFSKVDNACKTLDAFKNTLRRLNFSLVEVGTDAILCDFEWVQQFIADRNRLNLSPLEAVLIGDDLAKYHPDNVLLGPNEDQIADVKRRVLRTPVVERDMVYGRGDCGAVEEEDVDDCVGLDVDFHDPFLAMFDDELGALESRG